MLEGQDGKELSFERADVEGKEKESAVCSFCGSPIRNVYFETAGAIACAACRGRMLAERAGGSSAGRFSRAALFGVGAAILGSLLWYGVAKLTGYEFGLIAIVIGFLVGTGVRMGSRRRGGWIYQALAMFLTYGSIVSTYVPAILESAAAYEESSESGATNTDALAGGEILASAENSGAEVDPSGESAEESAGEPGSAATSPGEAAVAPIGGVLGFVIGVAFLFGLAFVAPFLGGLSNFMGWIILAIGLYEAWKLNRREELTFEGPFRLAGARSTYVPETPPPPIAP